jgi:hypothetical protein
MQVPQKTDGKFIYNNGFCIENTAQRCYADLIDKINVKGTWDSNPYAWVYDFELLKNKI